MVWEVDMQVPKTCISSARKLIIAWREGWGGVVWEVDMQAAHRHRNRMQRMYYGLQLGES